MARDAFQLTPLHVGDCQLGANHVLGEPYSDEQRIPFTLYAFLADGGPGRRVLIDLGPIGLDYLNEMFRRFDFFRTLPGDPDAIRQPHGNVFDWIKRLNLTPDDIDHIVLTHLHADHHGLTTGKDGGAAMRFPKAKIHVSKRGWQNNLDRRANGRWNSYVDYAFSDFLLAGEEQGRVSFHDDDEVIPGVEVFYLGGHAECSQGIRLQTDAGPVVIASDEIYLYSLFEKGILARLHTTPQRLLDASQRLAGLAKDNILVPCHDPVMAELYLQIGDAWLNRVRPISDRAANGFLNAPKKTLDRHDSSKGL